MRRLCVRHPVVGGTGCTCGLSMHRWRRLSHDVCCGRRFSFCGCRSCGQHCAGTVSQVIARGCSLLAHAWLPPGPSASFLAKRHRCFSSPLGSSSRPFQLCMSCSTLRRVPAWCRAKRPGSKASCFSASCKLRAGLRDPSYIASGEANKLIQTNIIRVSILRLCFQVMEVIRPRKSTRHLVLRV